MIAQKKSRSVFRKRLTNEEVGRQEERRSDDRFAAMKERDYKLVRGVFKRFKNEQVPYKFYFKKWAGPVMEFVMRDGHVYEIPYMVAKHLHENCYIPLHENSTDEDGNRIDVVGKKIKQFDFISPDILVSPDNDKNLVTVQRGV